MSDAVLAAFRKVMPPMSQTERDAIEAGTVWWDGELFSGRPDWQRLLATPSPTLTADEQHFLDHDVEELCAMVTDWETTHVHRDLPPRVWQFIKDRGFLGMSIAKEYGGLGFSAYAHSQVMTKLSTHSGTVSVTVMVPNSLGPGRAPRALRHRRAEAPLPAAAREGPGDPLLRAHRPDCRLGRGVDPRLRHRLLGRARGPARARALASPGTSATSRSARSPRCSASRSAPTTPIISSATGRTSASPAR